MTTSTTISPEQVNTEMGKYLEGRERFISKLTETERSLSEQLMLVGTVLISINAVVLSASGGIKHLHIAEKYFLLIGFILLTLSILSGIINYFFTMSFYKDWALALNRVITNLANNEYSSQETFRTGAFEIQDALPTSSNQVFMYLQIGLLAVALLLYMFLIIGVLF